MFIIVVIKQVVILFFIRVFFTIKVEVPTFILILKVKVKAFLLEVQLIIIKVIIKEQLQKCQGSEKK